eukprot:12668561-Alexandrium_andersonii.AAC.1
MANVGTSGWCVLRWWPCAETTSSERGIIVRMCFLRVFMCGCACGERVAVRAHAVWPQHANLNARTP